MITNVAGSSLPIRNAAYVIDVGLQKESSCNASTQFGILLTGPISQIHALQRKGRAGQASISTSIPNGPTTT